MPQPLSQLQNLLMRFTTAEKWLHAGAGVEIFPWIWSRTDGFPTGARGGVIYHSKL